MCIRDSSTASDGPDMLSYGASALVKSVSADLLSDLLNIYPANEAYSIMSIATLRVIRPKITLGRMATHYRRTFVCKDYPGAAMSKNTLGNLLQRIGQDGNKMCIRDSNTDTSLQPRVLAL